MATIEPDQTLADEEAHLRAKIQAGIDELDAGLGMDGEQVFARLRAKYFAVSDF